MMRAIAHYGVHHPVVVNLLVFTLVAAGLIFGVTLRREFFPEVRPNLVVVAAPYPGAAPDEIEQSLVLKIEDAIADLNDVVEIQTTVTFGAASVQVEFAEGVDIEDAVAQVKRKVDALEDLPPQSERIVVQELEPNLPAIALTYTGEGDERQMKRIIRGMRDDLESFPEMGGIVVSGVRNDEISVEVHPPALLEHSLSIAAVSQRITEAMREIPGGSVRTSSATISIRTIGAQEQAEEVRDIVVKALPEGSAIRIRDIADVTVGFEDVDLITRLNGKPAVSLTAFKVGDEDAVLISEMVRAYAAGRTRQPLELSRRESLSIAAVERSGSALPPRIAAYRLGLARPPIDAEDLIPNTDLARFITDRLELLSRNAFWGGIFVFASLLLLLNLRVALWVTAGLIISILGTLAFMAAADITLNLMTMFGLIIVIGILVDDGIVISENITARHEAGEPALTAAVNGMREVAWPVVATVITTVLAFGSLVFVQGQVGDMLAVLPAVVVVALSVSLIEALFVLPSHMAHSLHRHEQRARPGRVARFMDRMDERRLRLIQQVIVPRYLVILRTCATHRYITCAAAAALLIISLAMVAGGRLPFSFLGTQDAETIVVDLQMPIGTPLSATERIMARIERAALDQPEVSTALAVIGARSNADGRENIAQSHVGQIWIELKPGEERDRTSDDVIASIRQGAGDLPGIRSLRINGLSGGPEGPALTYTVTSDRPSLIPPVVQAVKDLLATVPMVYDVADDADAGARELRIELLPGARELGFTVESIAMQIRGWVYGLEPHTFAAPDEDVDVRVMLDAPWRRSLAAIEHLDVFTPDAGGGGGGSRAVPLREVARLTEAEAYATVRRLDRRRAVSVTAEVVDKASQTEKIAAQLAPLIAEIEREHRGVRILERGQQEEVADSLSTLPLGILVACSLIYVTLVILFNSFLQPGIILFTVPFSIVGMVWGHLALGYDLTMLSLIGFIALTGVVVNDAIIFIEFYNHKRREGVNVFDAVMEAGRARLRPIILTTLTTVLGLLPLITETSFQARFLIPMAITISFGLLAATVGVLLVTPCVILIGDDLRALARLLWKGERRPDPAEAYTITPSEHARM